MQPFLLAHNPHDYIGSICPSITKILVCGSVGIQVEAPFCNAL